MRTVKITSLMAFTAFAALLFFVSVIFLFPWLKKTGPAMLQLYSRVALTILGVRVESADKIPVPASENKGIILTANHVSMLDILLMSALYGTVYLSKEEVKYYPVIGLIARMIGIMFLKRESVSDRHRMIRKIARDANGRIITIFPQGTTSAISDRLPFKRGIFKAVEINRNAVLLPVTIRYKEDATIAWRRDQILIDNLKAICALQSIHVKVTIHEPISIADYADKTISDVCSAAQNKVFSLLWAEY